MNSFQAWSARLVEVSPFHFYTPNYFADYFPGYLYILWFLGNSFNFLFPNFSIFSLEFEFYLKLFTNVFDLLTAFFMYKIIANYNKNFSLIASAIYLINPASIFNSSVWGQVDGILTFFMIYSIYSLLELKNYFHFIFSQTLLILIKPQGLAILPVIILRLIANFKLPNHLILLLIPILVIIFSLPFFLGDPILGLFHLFQKSANIYPFTGMFTYNLWALIGWWIPDSKTFLDIPYQIWGVILFLLSLILILIPLLKGGLRNNFLSYFALSLTIFSFYLFLTRMHERYLLPFFAFLLIVVFIKKSTKLALIYIFLSISHFINLWHVYYYYNFIYPNPNFLPNLAYELLKTNYNLFTLSNLIGFYILLLIYYSYRTKE